MTDAPSRTVLITGAAGQVGRILLDRPPRIGWRYVAFDLDEPEGVEGRDDVRCIVGSIADAEAVRQAMTGVTDVVHLAGVSSEDAWSRILDINVDGTRTVLEAARDAGVGRFVLASSNHAAGLWTRGEAPAGGLPDDATPRPDTFYGWSKAAAEDLLRLFCERGDMRGVAVRIGHCFPEPRSGQRLAIWLSPRDARALVDAALENDIPPFQHVWGVSANTRGWLSSEGARRIGFTPRDDSEQFADRFDEEAIRVAPDAPLGAGFATAPLGEAMG
ncbi:NAD-dependent epimerase/dehydratase family protein [Microbacterium sp. gxy059]|uniref:NAD-dependent epimerase/dehydratase family protein n=1 Tax=Microbacterium sp. gxy059 TaxID=2957199 RepID=UPI003D9751D3